MLDAQTIPTPKRNPRLQTGWEGFFPYYAGFPESFAASILAGAGLATSSVILDPWNGSGTTTYVAASRGIHSIGFDLNPVMVVVAKARLLPSTEADSIEPLGAEILKVAEAETPVLTNDPLTCWFNDDTAQMLRAIERSICKHLLGTQTLTAGAVNLDRLSGIAATNYVALFSVCRELCQRFQSSNPTWLRRPKKGERRAWAARSTIERRFKTKLQGMANALSKCTHSRGNEPIVSDIRLTDTNQTALSQESVDLILTSPPYCTRIDYTAATRIELAVLHHLVDGTAEELGRQMTGSTRVPAHELEPIAGWGRTCNRFLTQLRKHPSKASAGYYYKTHMDYFDKMYRALGHCAQSLRPQGSAVLVVQDSFYKDVHNDLPAVIGEICEGHGLSRRWRKDFYIRRSMAGINPGAKAYERRPGANEAVLFFQKH